MATNYENNTGLDNEGTKKQEIATDEWLDVAIRVHNFALHPTVEGTYLGLVESTQGGKDVLLKDKDGELLLWGKKALLSQFKRIKELSEVKVVCLGKKQSTKSKFQYVDFKVYTKKF